MRCSSVVLACQSAIRVPVSVALIAAMPAIAAAAIQLGPPDSSPVGIGPYHVALADLDGDGRLDAVVSNYDGNRVSVSSNTGGGGFGPPSFHPVGWGLFSVAGDLDGDGRLDLVVANFQNASVSVLMNQGGGALSRTDYATGSQPRALALGDVTGDGNVDLAVAVHGLNEVRVHHIAGGVLSPGPSFAVGSGQKHVVTGDVDGDGRLDLLTANSSDGTITVLRQISGSSAVRSDIAVAPGVSCIALADFDGDNRLDVATANENGTAAVLLGNGDGTFDPAQSYAVGSLSQAIAAADLDADGAIDLVVSNFVESTVSVLRGQGNGQFDPGVNFPCGFHPRFVAIGDVDGDGKPDVVTADYNPVANGSFSVLINSPTTGGDCPRTDYPTGPHPSHVAVGDLNDDGLPDLAVSTEHGEVVVFRNDGTGFVPGPRPSPGTLSQSVAIGDLDGDGQPDIAVTNFAENSVSVHLNAGGGVFQMPLEVPVGPRPRFLTITDIEPDGRADIVTANYHDAIEPGSVTVLRGRGRPSRGQGVGRDNPDRAPVDFHNAETYEVGVGPYFVAAADVTGDGDPDLVVNNYDANTVSVLPGRGNGRFEPRQDHAVGWGLWTAIGDFDGDGLNDLAVANFQNSTVSLLTHAGGFPNRTDYPVGANPRALAAADLDGDGRLDLCIAEAGDDRVSFLANRGSAFEYLQGCAVGDLPKGIASGELDGAPGVDLAIVHDGSGTLSVMTNLELPEVPAATRKAESLRPAPVPATHAARFALGQSRPNPALRELAISFELPRAGRVRLGIYDVAGRLVRRLVDGDREAGPHVARWDRITDSGRTAAAGLYFYRLESGGEKAQRKLVLQ